MSAVLMVTLDGWDWGERVAQGLPCGGRQQAEESLETRDAEFMARKEYTACPVLQHFLSL